MSNVSNIDKNFIVKTNIQKDNIRFFDIRENPFKIYGVFWENGKYRRISENTAKNISVGINALHAHTAGGRVRFVTDSKYIAIVTNVGNVLKAPHATLLGNAGFDMYVGTQFAHSFVPPYDFENTYEGIAEFSTSELREITINFPLYGEVNEIYIGLENKAVLSEASPYRNDNPIVFYGSSITQGGCASRPGRSYQNILSREFNYDYINLGFSGRALGEETMANYIKSLKMHAFVLDYDHNAPTVEHLKNTHERMYMTVRDAHPDIPIIIMSRPKFKLTDEEIERRSIIETTYKNAVSNGDKNVYFLDGKALTAICEDEGTVDGIHPSDLGFDSMAKALCNLIIKYNI